MAQHESEPPKGACVQCAAHQAAPAITSSGSIHEGVARGADLRVQGTHCHCRSSPQGCPVRPPSCPETLPATQRWQGRRSDRFSAASTITNAGRKLRDRVVDFCNFAERVRGRTPEPAAAAAATHASLCHIFRETPQATSRLVSRGAAQSFFHLIFQRALLEHVSHLHFAQLLCNTIDGRLGVVGLPG
jgi:hypothetical protein